MSLYIPATADGQILARAELDRIATAIDAAEALTQKAYGGMRMDLGQTHNLSLSPTPIEVGGWDTVSPLRGITADLTAGELTVGATGVYDFIAIATLEGVSDIQTYQMTIRVNDLAAGGIPANAPEKKADRVVLQAFSLPAALIAGDRVSMWLESDGSSSVTLTRSLMRLVQLG